eukprot:6179318-Pleurochrysis_carterae.AAC.1
MALHDRKDVMVSSMFIVSSADSLATNLQAEPSHTHQTCNLPEQRVLIYDVPGGTIVDEPRTTEARFAAYSPCDISSCPNLQPPIMIISAVHSIWIRCMAILFMAIHTGRLLGGKGKTVYESLCTRIYCSVRTLLSVLSYFLFVLRSHYQHPFNHPFFNPYWLEVASEPYDCDSLIIASFDTCSPFIIINACGLDNEMCLLLFCDHQRSSTYGTRGRRNDITPSIHIRRVLTGKFTSSMEYLAINACYGLFQYIDD